MKRNAIIKIVLWSAVLLVLLGLFFALLYIPAAGKPLRENTTETWNTASDPYSGTPVRVDAAKIREMEIEWVAGSIVIQPADTDEISFREEDVGGSGKSMHWKIQGDKILIQYAEDGKFPLKARMDWKDETKDLIIEVPVTWQFDSLKVAAAASSLNVRDLSIREMEFDGASGECIFDNCTVEKLDLDTASGNVRFTGSLQLLDCDAASADIVLKLTNVPGKLDMDTASGDLDVTLPADAGFTVSMDTLSGDFESDFEFTMRNDNYVAGNGLCRIDVDAMSGDMIIRRGA